jgi:hypothetical protein
MSLQLGLPHFVMAVAGAVVGRRHRAVLAGFGVYLALLLLMSRAAVLVWQGIGRMVQFPWRILAVTAPLQILCFAGVAALAPRVGRSYALALFAVVLAALVWHHRQFETFRPLDVHQALVEQRLELRGTMRTFANTNEFLPNTSPLRSGLRPRGDGPLVEVEGATVTPLAGDGAHTIHKQVELAADGQVTINQLFFPGWRVELDGEAVPEEILRAAMLPDGRMAVAVAAGTHELRARYDGPPGWRARSAAVLIGLAGFAVMWWRERRRRPL